ncbi:MAG: protein kinase [Anaerolineales bacterium]|nr:protein kinase [Anaerolineales bacterium]
MTQEKFGRYVIKGEIGRGGMASVFHAYDPRFERDVAIKVLPREFLHDPAFRARFDREAKMVALLEHPAIVPVYDFGEEEGQPYIVMRFMSGGSLSDLLKKGPLPLIDVVKLINRLAPSLDAAHSKGIIHRDLKPGNILYDQYGNAFLSDFGIARLAEAGSGTLTGGAILGTPAYMSPEQVQGGTDIDGRSDIYAMGVILYQVLTGKTPYQADTAAKLMMMHILEPIPSIRSEKDDLPPLFDEVIERAMAKSPDTRYQTTQELADAVEEAAKNLSAATTARKASAKSTSAPTMVRPAATVLSPGKKGQAQAVPAQGGAAQAVAAPRKGIPIWLLIVGGLALLAIVAGGALVGGGIIALGSKPTPTIPPTATIEVIAQATQPLLTDTLAPSPTAPPSDTPVPAPTDTSVPAPTDTMVPTATETPIPEPAVPVIGDGDKIAFIRDNDVYAMNLDGTELVQLTNDSGEKYNLQWAPDGNSLIYILGKCVMEVTLAEGRVNTIVCINFISTLDAFEISPDGMRVAISMDKELYVIPFNREALAQATNRNHIKEMADCEALAPYSSSTGSPFAVRQARWADDMQKLSLIMLAAEPNGTQADKAYILDISTCTAPLARLDEFPGEARFKIANYNGRIENLAWDGQFNYAMIGFVRNQGFGDLYFYNSDLRKAQVKVNPLGNCCYRDPSFSPDGSHLVFAYQDLNQGENATIQLYVINFGMIGTGVSFNPLPLPEDFFTDVRESPQPVLRPYTGQ